MAFPALKPTSRTFDPGDWPIKTFRAQSGAEVRILYGNSRTGMKLELDYSNITDSEAEGFLTHFNETLGTLRTFDLPAVVRSGWQGSAAAIDNIGTAEWRYAQAPAITSVRPGISSVTISLVGVL